MSTANSPIVIMDSGVGGLPYLEAARSRLPDERFIYLADRAGFPYGTKSGADVRAVVLDRVERLIGRFDPKAVVIACNTASQAALAAVRAANPGLPFIGTVPAIKPAAAKTRSGVIAVMATAQTVKDPYLDDLVARFAPEVTVLREPAQDLVSFVELRLFDATPEERREIVFRHVRPLLDAGADQIVLACTHFLYLRDDIAAAAGPAVEVVDSRDGIAGHLSAVLAERRLLRAGPGESGLLLLSGDRPAERAYGLFADRFGLEGPELLPVS